MTPDQIKALSDVASALYSLSSGDPEIAHGEADALLLKALGILGAHGVVECYIGARERIGFWYA